MEYLLPSWMQEPLRRCIGKELTPAWLNAEWFRERSVRPRVLIASDTEDVLRETLCRTLMHNTLPGLLRYEDRNSMAFSIESRVPFLTSELVQFLLSLPEEFIIAQDGTSKAIFREAMRGLVPAQILARRDKVGFSTPEESWLRVLHHWVSQVLESDVVSALQCLRPEKMRMQWNEIVSDRRPMNSYVWRWLNLILWTEKFKVQWT
jgi:asparagine synthase (glutamine-hydrolysing)